MTIGSMVSSELSILLALYHIMLFDSQNNPMIEYRISSKKKKGNILKETNKQKTSG